MAACGITSATNTNAITATVTIVGPTAESFLTIFPADAAQRPSVSNINWAAGQQPTANQFMVPLSTAAPAGAIKIYNASGTVEVIIDINGRYAAG